jgi:hypothetical protein
VTGHVLDDFSELDKQLLDPLLVGVTTHIARLIKGDGAEFISKVTTHVASLN